jgi:CBS domain containing-hemolysin-like protein
MFLFFTGLLLYYLVMLSEQALVTVRPHDLESGNTGHPLALYRQIRPALAALLLARLLLAVLMAVCLMDVLYSSSALRLQMHQMSQGAAMPGWLIWGALQALLALGFAALLTVLRRFSFKNAIQQHPGRWLNQLSGFIFFWKKIFTPFIRNQEEQTATGAENRTQNPTAAEMQATAGEKRELEMLKSIVQFSDTTVRQVMQPRTKVVAVDFRTGFHQLLQSVRASEFSRLPVYHEDLDNVTGILYVKDLVPHLGKPDDFEWQSLIRTNLLLVPETKRCSEMLEDFKREKVHMAIVVDEYGGSAGIVTMEDILEEVTGDIRDEFDEDSDIRYRKLDPHNFIFEGQTLLNDVSRVCGLDPDIFETARNSADTLAGLILEIRGEIPQAGTVVRWNNFIFRVLAANKRRIEQIKLTLPR